MIEIRSETELNIAVRALEEYAAAIEAYHNSRKEFEVGAFYKWRTGEAAPSQGNGNGLLECVYVGKIQGAFNTVENGAAFENQRGLHIIATAHLKSGALFKVS